MKRRTGLFILSISLLVSLLIVQSHSQAQASQTRFRVLALAENGGHHLQYSQVARQWLNELAKDSNFSVDFINNTDKIDDQYLGQYDLFIQLDFPPYAWKEKAEKAFEKYIKEGRGGWIGFHHATLLGEFDGYPMWQWFSDYMGSIRFKDYIAEFADGKVEVEDLTHPVMKNVPQSFVIKKEEWYTYDKNPRDQVHVIATVDESTYYPATNKKMGDHPVIWTNKNFTAKNVYIFMGHSPLLFDDENYKTIFTNAIFWAASK